MIRSPFAIAVIAALLLGSPAAAQQSPAHEQQPSPANTAGETPPRPAELKVELAERRDADAPVIAKKRRAVRVSRCRCGNLASQQ